MSNDTFITLPFDQDNNQTTEQKEFLRYLVDTLNISSKGKNILQIDQYLLALEKIKQFQAPGQINIQSQIMIQQENKRSEENTLKQIIFTTSTDKENALQHSDTISKFFNLCLLKIRLYENRVLPSQFKEIPDKEYARDVLQSLNSECSQVYNSLTMDDFHDLEEVCKKRLEVKLLKKQLNNSKEEIPKFQEKIKQLEMEISGLKSEIGCSFPCGMQFIIIFISFILAIWGNKDMMTGGFFNFFEGLIISLIISAMLTGGIVYLIDTIYKKICKIFISNEIIQKKLQSAKQKESEVVEHRKNLEEIKKLCEDINLQINTHQENINDFWNRHPFLLYLKS